MHIRRLQILLLNPALNGFNHFGSNGCFSYSNSSLSMVQKITQNKVGIFWDLDNKPPNSISPLEAANKLKRAVASFGIVKYMVAYANRHSFSYVPPSVLEQRKEQKLLNQLENKGIIKPVEPYVCRVCGRKFHKKEKLINHFEIHKKEHQKRVSQIEPAKGKKRVNLVGKYAMKMKKYEKAAQDILTPKVGYGLADELKRAGFWVKTVSDKPQAVDSALRNHMVDMMDHRRVDCLVLVSDDSDFVGVLKEARERCVKTVVVGDQNDGVLKRNADACFSWREILVGKAKKEAVSVLGRWKDHDILKILEWSYNPQDEEDVYKWNDAVDVESEEDEVEDDGAWWELDSDDSDADSSRKDSK